MRTGRPCKNEEPLKERLGFRVTESLHEEILYACHRRGISKTDFIIESLEKNLEKHHAA